MSLVSVSIVIINILIAIILSLGFAPILVWMERRVAGFIQDRLGPNRCHIGGFRLGGLIQSIADMIKLVFKEDYKSSHIKKSFYFILAPSIVFFCAFLTFMVIPLADNLQLGEKIYKMQALPINFGILWFLAFAGLSVYGIMIGGWASDNKYALLGSIRSCAQVISYEASMTLSLISLLIVYASIDLNEIVNYQGQLLFGFLPAWGVIIQPLAALIFIITAFAETNRAPFDMAEGESEIVGFHVEYSAMSFGLFFVGEYIAMSASSALIVTLLFGGYQIPFLNTQFLKEHINIVLWIIVFVLPLLCFLFARWIKRQNKWIEKNDIRARESKYLIFSVYFLCFLIVMIILYFLLTNLSQNGVNISVAILQVISFSIKLVIMNFVYIWVRWTLPRFRYDTLQALGWKVLLPLALFNILITALVVAGV